MLGIVNPSTLVLVEAIKKASKMVIETLKVSSMTKSMITVDAATGGASRICPAFGKTCDKCGGKNHFKTASLSQGMTQRNQMEPTEEINACTDVMSMKLKIVMKTAELGT